MWGAQFLVIYHTFDIFTDLPEAEAAELQNKLEVLNNIMDQEVGLQNIKVHIYTTVSMV